MVWYNNQEYKKDEKSKDGEKTDLKSVKISIETAFVLCTLTFSLEHYLEKNRQQPPL